MYVGMQTLALQVTVAQKIKMQRTGHVKQTQKQTHREDLNSKTYKIKLN